MLHGAEHPSVFVLSVCEARGSGPAMREAVVAGHISLDVYPALHGPLSLEPGRLVPGPTVMSTGEPSQAWASHSTSTPPRS